MLSQPLRYPASTIVAIPAVTTPASTSEPYTWDARQLETFEAPLVVATKP